MTLNKTGILLITYSAILFITQLYRRGSVFPLQIPVPIWLVELCVPIGMGIFSIFALFGLIKAIRRPLAVSRGFQVYPYT